MAPVGRWGKERSSLPAFGEKRRKAEVSTHRYRIIERSEFEKAGGLAVGAQRRASNLRFRSARRGKSFGVAADAEMPDVLPGVWIGSLASAFEHISGLTTGSRLIPLCPLGKSSGIGAVAEMTVGFRACDNWLTNGSNFISIETIHNRIKQ